MRRFRGVNRFISGFTCVLLCLSLGYLYLFSLPSQQITIDSSTGLHRGLLSEQLRVQRSLRIQEKVNPEEGRWEVLPGNITVHVGNHHNPHNYTTTINNERVCEGLELERLSILIYIESEIRNWDRRQAIRDTWGQLALQKEINFRIVFLLGASADSSSQNRVQDEAYRYGDIIQEDFPESFRNLALKSVMGLKWATEFCSNTDYVTKTDDDIFIHVPNLRDLLREETKRGSPSEDYLICHKNRLRNVIRSNLLEENVVPQSYRKYLVRPDELPGQFYPAYCAGFAYVTTVSTAKRLYQAALGTPYFFIEDALITGFCRQKAGVELRDHGGFTLRPPVSPREGSCAFREGRATSQEMGPTEMRELWREINTRGFFCPQVVGYIPNNEATF